MNSMVPAKGAQRWAVAKRNVSFTGLLLDMSLARILLTILLPFRQMVAWQLLCGRRVIDLIRACKTSLLRLVGWLSLPPKTRFVRSLALGLIDLRRWQLVAAAMVLYSTTTTILQRYKDSKNEALQQRALLLAKMYQSKNYFEWTINAAKLDALDGIDQELRWKQETKLYDRKLLEEKVAHLRRVRMNGGSIAEQMFAIRADLMRNLGNITNSALHQHFPVVPEPIREYIDEVTLHLQQITQSTELSLAERAAFLKETRHAFGRTALVLSGGGALGAFHLGVVRALLEHKMLPRVLAGSSVGAIVCALVATRNDEELYELMDNLQSVDLSFFSNSSLTEFVTHLWSTGSLQDAEVFMNRLRHMLGDLTFAEAYAHTGRVLNVSVTAADTQEPPRLLNYLTAPHVIIWSAVAASSAFPGLFKPVDLMARTATGALVRYHPDSVGGDGASQRRWRDGSLEEDLPMRGLSELFSVNYFIVSQTNPHIVPFLNLKKKLGTVGQLAETEFKHRCRQLMTILPDWMPGKWLKCFSQPWEGDITIIPPQSLSQLTRVITNPTNTDLLHAVQQGELSTWGKLSAIQCNCGIETTLDSCIQQVSAWERLERRKNKGPETLKKLKSRIPSWINFDLNNVVNNLLHHSASVDSLDSTIIWEGGEDHLPLPEERPSTHIPAHNTITAPHWGYECTDASVMYTTRPGGGLSPGKILGSVNTLDAIAP